MPRSTRRAARAAATDTADIARQLHQLQDDLAELAEAIRHVGVGQAEHAAGVLNSALESARSTVRMSAAEARHRGEAVAEEVEAAITRNPLTAVLIAAGVGYLASKLFRR